jgi:hypothetical protein
MKTSSILRSTLLALALLPQPMRGDDDCIVFDDFAKAAVGTFPSDWKVRKDAGKDVYKVAEEGGKKFLRAESKGLGIQAAFNREWDLNRYPVLRWSWRAQEFPRGANEKDGENDSALAVYMGVHYSRIRGPKAVKYIWSEVVPVGTRLKSNGGLTQVKVLDSGAAKRGQWVEQQANVRDDWLAFFGEKEVPKPVGIAVLTDADDTKSSAQGDYANFRACAR